VTSSSRASLSSRSRTTARDGYRTQSGQLLLPAS
jgi:hypothetical protein